MSDDELYPCIGVCIADPDSGYCQGCGRPLVVISQQDTQALVPAGAPQPSETRVGVEENR